MSARKKHVVILGEFIKLQVHSENEGWGGGGGRGGGGIPTIFCAHMFLRHNSHVLEFLQAFVYLNANDFTNSRLI